MHLARKSLSLRARLLFWIGGSVTLGLVALISFVTWRSTRVTESQAMARGVSEANGIALNVGMQMNKSAAVIVQFGKNLENSRKHAANDRARVADQLRIAFESALGALGAWVCFEANAFDGKDVENAGKPGSDEQGRFSPYWNRVDGKLNLEFCPEYWNKDYYKQVFVARRPLLLEPYWDDVGGKKTLMTSYAVPVFDGDVLIGVAGMDFELGQLGSIANDSSFLKECQGYVTIVSTAGNYVSHPSKERLGLPFLKYDPWAEPYMKDISAGRSFMAESFSHTLNSIVYRLGSPLVIGVKTSPWSVVVNVPRNQILSSVHELRNQVLLISGVILLILAGILVLLSAQISGPIQVLVGTLREGATHTAEAAGLVSNSSQTLAHGASQQASALEESSASLEELSSMTRQNAQYAGESKAIAAQAREAADQGTQEMAAMQTAMGSIKVSSDEIAKIIKTIDEIAFQTNILALNAAVEAARAGESGAGFAVVAEEVRNLAQRSASAARETSAKIEGAIQNTAHGVEISAKVAASLQEIAEKIRKVDDLTAQVAGAVGEQDRGLAQINKAMGEMDRITQANAATAEESASAAEELNAQSEVQRDSVNRLDVLIRGGAKVQESQG